ncbi:Hypothetical predicted protein, partial [Pelobates cultripes]
LADSGSESEVRDSTTETKAPHTRHDLQRLLKEVIEDIKSYMAVELEKHVAGLKADLDALTSRTSQTETHITGLLTKTKTQSQDITALHEKIIQLEDGMEDLNNRSHRNNICIRGMTESMATNAILSTIGEIFQSLLLEVSTPELTINRAHWALRSPMPNASNPRAVI